MGVVYYLCEGWVAYVLVGVALWPKSAIYFPDVEVGSWFIISTSSLAEDASIFIPSYSRLQKVCSPEPCTRVNSRTINNFPLIL